MDNQIQEIKERLNIVDIIGEHVELRKTGINYKAPCPFHREKTPSFVVSEEKQIWHCFGCDKGGDIFGFVKEIEGLEFRQALELLAGKAGVALVKQDPVQATKKNRLFDLMMLACEFYHQGLLKSTSGEIARAYLKKRRVPSELIDRCGIGFSPDSYSILSSFLLKRGYTLKEMSAVGLVVAKPDGRFYDRFRNRLMFPIFDAQGRVVGFGGRILVEDKKAPKYLNSPETELYNKSSVLYGLNWAKSVARDAGYMIMVEGYMDVIASHKAGAVNVVATSGTALTDSQVHLLQRYVQTVYLSFDMDSAGEQATKRGVDKLLKAGIDIKIITLPGGKDCDELVRENPEQWIEAVKAAKPLLDHYFDKYCTHLDHNDPKQKSRVFKDLIELIAYIPDIIEKTHYAKKLSDILGISEQIAFDALRVHGRAGVRQYRKGAPEYITKTEKDVYVASLRHIYAMLMLYPAFVGKTPEFIFQHSGNKLLDILAEVLKRVYSDGKHDTVDFFQLLEKMYPNVSIEAKQIMLAFEEDILSSSPEESMTVVEPIFLKMILNVKRLSLKEKIGELSVEMRRAERENKLDEVERLEKMFSVLTNELKQI